VGGEGGGGLFQGGSGGFHFSSKVRSLDRGLP